MPIRADTPRTGRVLPNAPVNLPLFRAANVEARFRAAQILGEDSPFDTLDVTTNQSDGNSVVTTTCFAIGYGNGGGVFTLGNGWQSTGNNFGGTSSSIISGRDALITPRVTTGDFDGDGDGYVDVGMAMTARAAVRRRLPSSSGAMRMRPPPACSTPPVPTSSTMAGSSRRMSGACPPSSAPSAILPSLPPDYVIGGPNLGGQVNVA